MINKEPSGSDKAEAIRLVSTDGTQLFNSGKKATDINLLEFAPNDGSTNAHAGLTTALSQAAGKKLIIPAGYTFILSTATPIEISSDTTIQLDGIIRQTQTGDAGIFLIDAGSSNITIYGKGSLEGPYTASAPVPSGSYPASNGAIRINGDYDSLVEEIYIEGLEFFGWGMYGVFAENVTNGSIRHCHFHKIGRDGVRSYGCEYFDVSSNHIHNISPGLSGNAYGVTYTRRPDNVATPLTVNPPSRRCKANENIIWDITVWKGLDTHGGIDIEFNNNVIESCKIGIGIDEGDTTTLDDAPPINITVSGNIIKLGDASAVESGINVASSDAANPAQGIIISENTIEGCGGTNRGAINLNYLNDAQIINNILIDSVVAGIRFKTECVGVYCAGNLIKDMTGTIVAAIASEDADSIIMVDSGVFRRTTGSYTAISLATPTSNTDGVKINFDGLDFIGTITQFVSGHESRTRSNLEEATGTITLDPATKVAVINSNGGAVTATLGNGPEIGFVKTIVMTDATNSSTVSITNHETTDPEVATFDAVDETGVFLWTGTEWVTIFATCTF